MKIDTNAMVSISEANQNFSKVARLVDQFGSAVILKNNSPRYIIMEFKQAEALQTASGELLQAAPDELVQAASSNLMIRNKKVYKELAK